MCCPVRPVTTPIVLTRHLSLWLSLANIDSASLLLSYICGPLQKQLILLFTVSLAVLIHSLACYRARTPGSAPRNSPTCVSYIYA